MNEELIKKALQLKLTAADNLLDRLPPETSKKIRAFGALACDSIGAHLKSDLHESTTQAPGNIKNVHID